jgi:hypothetical protein
MAKCGNFDITNATFTQFKNNNSDLYFSTSVTGMLPSFYEVFKLVFESSNPTGFNTIMGSRLIPERLVLIVDQMILPTCLLK